jgi:hypothetical protein
VALGGNIVGTALVTAQLQREICSIKPAAAAAPRSPDIESTIVLCSALIVDVPVSMRPFLGAFGFEPPAIW